jgi:hypothetical protein
MPPLQAEITTLRHHLQPQPCLRRDVWRGRRRRPNAAEIFLQPIQFRILQRQAPDAVVVAVARKTKLSLVPTIGSVVVNRLQQMPS